MSRHSGTSPLLRNAQNAIGSPSKRLIAAYVFDWLVILGIAGVGAGINFVPPKMRAFSLMDLSISFPLIDESISTATVGIAGFLAPAVIITAVIALLVPGRRLSRSISRAEVTRLKLWELEKGLAGLALALATAFFITQGMKNLFGKPRPDLLARCDPDFEHVSDHYVGGFGQSLDVRWVLVKASICRQSNKSILNDGFRSFPSGHSSWSWSGLLYLSLFLCSKFAIAIPHLSFGFPSHERTSGSNGQKDRSQEMLPLHSNQDRDSIEASRKPDWPRSQPDVLEPLIIRNTAATPPNYLLVIAFVPIAVAVYINSTRYAEYYHFGWDIIGGSLIGAFCAWFAFRWYHLPISRGQGWAWGSRSRDRAFAIGVGTGGYVGDEGWDSAKAKRSDPETGPA